MLGSGLLMQPCPQVAPPSPLVDADARFDDDDLRCMLQIIGIVLTYVPVWATSR